MTTVPFTLCFPSTDNGVDGRSYQPGESRPTMQPLEIQSFSYEERHGVLPILTSGLTDCGGWVVNRKTLSPNSMEFRLEIQLRAVVDLYASIVASGLELTRAGHLALAELCTCRQNLTTIADLGQVISIRLEISLLEDVTLHSLLLCGGSPA